MISGRCARSAASSHRTALTQETRNCYRAAVDALRRLIHAGNVNLALTGEDSIYTAFVNNVEDEQHYYRCFADWKDDLAALGRRFREPGCIVAGRCRPNRLFSAFGPHPWSHQGAAEDARIAAAHRPALCRTPRLHIGPVLARFRGAVPCGWCRGRAGNRRPGAGSPVGSKISLAEGNASSRIAWVCVWVSRPTMAAFALSMRLAPVQIFWALRFHPVFRTIHRRLHNLRRETGARAIDWKAVMEGRPGAADHCHDAGRF